MVEESKNDSQYSEKEMDWITDKKGKHNRLLATAISVIIVILLISWSYHSYYTKLMNTPDNENAELEMVLNVTLTNGSVDIHYNFNNLGERPANVIDPGDQYMYMGFSANKLNPALKINFTDSTGKEISTIRYYDVENRSYPTSTIEPGEHASIERLTFYLGDYGMLRYTSLYPWDWFAFPDKNNSMTYEYRNTTAPYYITLTYDSTLFQNDDVWKGQLASNTVVINEIPTPTASP